MSRALPHRGKRPFYPARQVERIALESLKAVSLYPSSPNRVRVERFVEKHFKLPRVTFEELPSGVLGCTLFKAGQVHDIIVSRQLDEVGSRVADRRLRTTIAHEAGHGLLHAMLFDESPELSLFGSEDVQEDKVLCRDVHTGNGYSGKWWELQANMMIGALLMPAPLMTAVVDRYGVESSLGVRQLNVRQRHEAKLELADVFDVNPVVAEIRIHALYPHDVTGQLTL